MMKIKNLWGKTFSFIKKHKIWSVIIGIVVLGIVYYSFLGGSSSVSPTFVLAEKGTIKEEVSVTGNVKPLENVDLAFERGGRVANINVAVGDKVYAGENLASVSSADLIASLDQTQANLKKALAQYQDVKAGTRAEQIALEESQVEKATSDLAQAKVSLVSAIKNSYTSADDAVRNKMYSLFTEPGKYNAKLSFTTDTFIQEDIENSRNVVSDTLDSWYQSLIILDSSSDLETYYNTAKSNLTSIKNLLDKCATAVNGLSPNTAYVTQTQIDTWKVNISLARTIISGAIDSLTASYDAYTGSASALKISQDQLTIGQAGSTEGEVLSAEASYESAQAGVASAQAELNKSIIKSPIDGVVTNINPKLGEIVSANQNAISVISYGDYEVETFVPEADISKVKIGNQASTTLDAYGSGVNFETMVIKIDPAATVIDGVPTYKVTLKFTTQDDRVKSGMTANLDILTAEKIGVITVPARAVYTKDDGFKYVKILGVKDVSQEVRVEVGLRGIDGMVEVISGVNVGDKVVTSL
jgi:multidrug efflux pump subunit AcrA (membrane-fusion protein)